ncbi:hypothetical protein ACE939_05890 [Aquimarina sp. W85]|uniref:hypothetical protein n=1 Tax=Aquimarina rhodophyticola TaxID=3342246 RepID=UPI00366CF8DD
MKKKFYLNRLNSVWILTMLVFTGYAQIDRSKPRTLSNPLGSPTNLGSGLNASSSSLLNGSTSMSNSNKFTDYGREKEPKKLTGENDFFKETYTFTPNYLKRKEDEENSEGMVVQYLGDFGNNGRYVQIVYRDFGSVDGDVIRVYLDDDIIRNNVYLTGDYKGLLIDLLPGSNKIVIEALNQGTSGPNTAQFKIFDDSGALITSNKWNLLAGGKATLIIIKE